MPAVNAGRRAGLGGEDASLSCSGEEERGLQHPIQRVRALERDGVKRKEEREVLGHGNVIESGAMPSANIDVGLAHAGRDAPDSAKRVGRGQRRLEDRRPPAMGAAGGSLWGEKSRSTRAREASS